MMLQIIWTQKDSSLSDTLCRTNLQENLWATHLLHTKQISVHIRWQPGTSWGPLNVPQCKCLPACWQSNLNVLLLAKTYRRPGKVFFLAFFLICTCCCTLFWGVRMCWTSESQRWGQYLTAIFFWARFEGQNLFHVADAWRCCWSPVIS